MSVTNLAIVLPLPQSTAENYPYYRVSLSLRPVYNMAILTILVSRQYNWVFIGGSEPLAAQGTTTMISARLKLLGKPNHRNRQPVPSAVARLEKHLLRRIAAGLLVLIPLLVTLLVIRFFVLYIDGFVRPLPYIAGRPWDVPGIGLAVAAVVLYIFGAFMSTRIGRRTLDWKSSVLGRIPLIRSVYGFAKQATDAFVSPSEGNFKRVVLIEWPRSGMMALGLVTGHCVSPRDQRPVLAVYVPTVPNPTSGNLAFVYEDEVVETDMQVEDAMKIVFSGGMVLSGLSQNGVSKEEPILAAVS